jgi:cytidine deaminase
LCAYEDGPAVGAGSPGLLAGLVEAARRAREAAYVPYSGFAVGAAALAVDGSVHTGCNVENSSYGLTICAERAAIFGAVSAGRRDLVAIAVVAGTPGPPRPCGACLQVMAEFNPNLKVVMGNLGGLVEVLPLGELLPRQFRLEGKA